MNMVDLRERATQAATAAATAVRIRAERVRDTLPPPVWRLLAAPSLHSVVMAAIVLALLASWGPQSYHGYVTQLICVYAVATLGLNITTGYAGALSLGQGAAFAIGAYVTGVLVSTYEWPFWLALLLATVAGLLAGAAAGFPAGRLGVIGLAMMSLGLVLVVGDMLIQFRTVTGGMFGIPSITARYWFGQDPAESLWVVPIVIVVVAGLCYWLHARYRVSRLGRSTVAVRDEPIGASALGISGYLTKVAAFAVGSAFAALAGGLFSLLSGYISPDAFSSHLSILFLVMVVLGGSGSRFGPVVGAILLVIIPLQLAEYPHLNTIIYGLLLIVLMRLRPRGLFSRSAAPAPQAMRPLFDAVAAAAPAGSAESTPPEPGTAAPAGPADRTPAEPTPIMAASAGERTPAENEPTGPRPRRGTEVLRLTDVRRSFGGVDALAGVSLSLARGEILGLIGPNGSGKTTLLNVVCGHYPPTAGEIHLGGEPIAGRRPEAIARLGVARTFQTPKTFDGMSIEEHLALATAQGDRDPELLRACRAGALALLEMGGLDPRHPASLMRESRVMSHGQLRFLEAATAISTCPRVLLLDEPAAGLSAAEIEGFERVVHDVARAGIGVIIVEHHLEMISRLVDRVVVLDLGKVLWTGPPADLHDAESVRAAYMGIV